MLNWIKTHKKFLVLIPAIVLVAASCDTKPSDKGSYAQDSNKVESTQTRLQTATPIPDLTNSAERQNIAQRAKTFDDVNKVTYIYLVSYGKVMAFYTVKGKVSSLNSYLSPIDKIVYGDGSRCDEGAVETPDCYVVQAPDIDGAYGENTNGIFFFTTDGAYVEWKGDYMVSDQPLKLTTQPELIREIK